MPQGRSALGRRVAEVLEDADNNLTLMMRQLARGLMDELLSIEKRILEHDATIQYVNKTQEKCQRISGIRGMGPITATAFVASIGDANHFDSGRSVGAWLGIVPKQHSTGGKDRLLGISKHGDSYLRKLLIHGARSVVCHAGKRNDRLSRWIQKKERTRGFNKTCVALANKQARVAWAMLKRGTEYNFNR
jgi:transposase